MRESRLLCFSSTEAHSRRAERHELLGQRIARGSKFHSVDEAAQVMKSDAHRCVEDLGKTKVGWLSWLNHLCSTELALKSGIRERSRGYADRMLQQTGLAVGVLAGNMFRRGKRQLMLVRRAQYEKEFLDDMQTYYREKESDLERDEQLYGKLASAFKQQRVAVYVGSPGKRQTILNAIGSLMGEVEAEKGKREANVQDSLEDFQRQAHDEQHLKRVLLKLGVIESSTQLHDLLERNARDGDTTLSTLIKNHPTLRVVDRDDLRDQLLQTVNDLRRRGRWYTLWMVKGQSGWYRAFLEGQKQPVSVEETFRQLQDQEFDRRVRAAVPGGPREYEVERKDPRRNLYYLFDPVLKKPAILDITTRELSYAERGGSVRNFSFDDAPNSITLV